MTGDPLSLIDRYLSQIIDLFVVVSTFTFTAHFRELPTNSSSKRNIPQILQRYHCWSNRNDWELLRYSKCHAFFLIQAAQIDKVHETAVSTTENVMEGNENIREIIL